jgi:hypothetical protein
LAGARSIAARSPSARSMLPSAFWRPHLGTLASRIGICAAHRLDTGHRRMSAGALECWAAVLAWRCISCPARVSCQVTDR